MLNAKTFIMKRFLILLTFLAFAITSCKRDHSLSKKDLEKMTFQGKYLGEGCWSVIQVTKPSIREIGLNPSWTQWGKETNNRIDTLYNNAIGAGIIPKKFRNGALFYFTVSKLDSNIIHTADCAAPKYYFGIKTISFNNPNDKSQQ